MDAPLSKYGTPIYSGYISQSVEGPTGPAGPVNTCAYSLSVQNSGGDMPEAGSQFTGSLSATHSPRQTCSSQNHPTTDPKVVTHGACVHIDVHLSQTSENTQVNVYMHMHAHICVCLHLCTQAQAYMHMCTLITTGHASHTQTHTLKSLVLLWLQGIGKEKQKECVCL